LYVYKVKFETFLEIYVIIKFIKVGDFMNIKEEISKKVVK